MAKPEMTNQIDPNTGEKVKRCPIPKEIVVQIDSVIQEHQGTVNQFLGLSQQICRVMKSWFQADENILKSDKAIKEKMKYACKKLGLAESDPWSYNLQHKIFELREPPELKPFTASQTNEEKDKNNG